MAAHFRPQANPAAFLAAFKSPSTCMYAPLGYAA